MESRMSERNGKDESKANGRKEQTKKEPNIGNRGAGSGAIVELVSRPIHKSVT